MALAETDQPAAPKGPSLVVQLAMLAAMTAAALGAGWFAGATLKRSEAPPQPPRLSHDKKAEAKPEEKPADVWVRMEATVVFDAPQPAEVQEAIHQDILAFLRTVKMHQVEGASGYQHLKADLQERAAIRSGGHARDILIRTLIFE